MKKSFLYLFGVTMAALLAVFFIPEYGVQEVSNVDTLLLPGISEHINEVDRVEIVAAGNHVVATMLKTDSGWQLQQMAGYHADWSKLQTLLAAVAQARVVAAKTDKPEYYARLGVEDINQDSATSILLNMGIGEQTSGVLIGKQAQASQGQYVRLQNQAASAEIDRKLDVPTELLDWVDSTIIDVNASEVAEVEIIHPQGERVLVMRISADQTDFDLAGLPANREIKSSWAVNSLGSVLSLLEMESVQPEGDFSWDDAVRMRLLMFSGVELIADLVESDDQYLLRLKASHPAAGVVNKQPPESNLSDEQQEIEQRAAADIAARVAAINQKVDGWVYAISKRKYDSMISKPEDLLKPLDTP
ncbi:MAG: DUF4340 domain-containing protein [Xanthomonadales bacterium]|nr:DUF4340 domain-containing protein [Xanthomonadales bacterium]